jgi:alkylation response protein AidB-like acyl-CoA dehydrogenase
MAQTTDEFIEAEVLPNLPRLENKDWDVARALIRRCGELGLLGVDAPEAYGGLALDKTSSVVVAERMSRAGSFAVTFGGQTNLSILPIVLFGTLEQPHAAFRRSRLCARHKRSKIPAAPIPPPTHIVTSP